jgi:hypothetical protein
VQSSENKAGLRAFLASPQMVKAMEQVTEKGKARAEVIAPVDTGRYAFGVNIPPGEEGGGFEIESGVKDGHAYARLINRTFYAYWLERGTKYMRRQRIIGRAIEAMRP